VAALATDGPLANMYLGSVEWGWRSQGRSAPVLDPAEIRVISHGPPSAQFEAAAERWNDARFADRSTGQTYDTVDLPEVGDRPADLSDAALAARITALQGQMAGLDGEARSRAQVECRGLELERQRRAARRGRR
jgi:hypothetical protein